MSHGLSPTVRSPLLLTLDGGGVRGLSSLLILKALMEKLRENDGPTPRPCQYFDMICGTSTGGLIAIMLGRLRMDVDGVIKTYLELGTRIFGIPRFCSWMPKSLTKNKVDAKEKALQCILKSLLAPLPSPLNNDIFISPPDLCKSVVIAIHDQRGCQTPYLFRSYDHPQSKSLDPYERNPGSGAAVPIWQVARATTAAPVYFEAIKIWDKTFYDRGSGFGNPTLDAFLEIQQMYGDSKETVTLTLSVGTGRTSPRAKKRLKTARGQQLAERQTAQSEYISQTLEELYKGKPAANYYRFDVDTLETINPNDWTTGSVRCGRTPKSGTLQRVKELTQEYLDKPEVQKRLDAAADIILENVPDTHLGQNRVQTSSTTPFVSGAIEPQNIASVTESNV